MGTKQMGTRCKRRFHLSPVDLSKRRRRPRKREKTSLADADGGPTERGGEMQRPERGQINVKVIGLARPGRPDPAAELG